MYANITTELIATMRGRVDVGEYQVHSAANAFNALALLTQDEMDTLIASVLNDSVTICSWSPFNTYWILQGT